MTTPLPSSDLPVPVSMRPATQADQQLLARLWLMFRHEMSAFTGALPNPDGTYRDERLVAALADPSWRAWMLTAADHPLGFALVRALDEPVHVLTSFFLVTPARRRGLGTRFASGVIEADPAAWAIAFQDANVAAARFWPKLAAAFDPAWRLERRAVAGRPGEPPDMWVTFSTGRPGPG